MTPVGLIIILLGIAIAYQLVKKLPGLIAGTVAVIIAIITRIQNAKAAKALLELDRSDRIDPWKAPSRRERKIMSNAFDLAIKSTIVTSLLPEQTMAGYGLARRIGFA